MCYKVTFWSLNVKRCYIFLKGSDIERAYKEFKKCYTIATQTSSESMKSQGIRIPTLEKLVKPREWKITFFAGNSLLKVIMPPQA